LEEYKEKIKELQTDKNQKLNLLYSSDPHSQFASIRKCTDRGYDVVIFDNVIDNHFIQHLEYKEKESVAESVLSEEEMKAVENLFKQSSQNKSSQTLVQSLSPSDPPIQIVRPEFMRRMSEMQHMMHFMKGDESNPFKDSYTVQKEQNDDEKNNLANYLIQLAMIENQMLSGKELHEFVQDRLQQIG
jgi:molecular chaperone HtpG